MHVGTGPSPILACATVLSGSTVRVIVAIDYAVFVFATLAVLGAFGDGHAPRCGTCLYDAEGLTDPAGLLTALHDSWGGYRGGNGMGGLGRGGRWRDGDRSGLLR